MKVALIAKPGHDDSGIGRYVQKLAPALRANGLDVALVYPTVPFPSWLFDLVEKLLHWDLHAFFLTYPIRISYPRADIYHFSSQNLASILVFRRPPGKIIVTLHDLIPVVAPAELRAGRTRNIFYALFERLALIGLNKADYLISVSEFTGKIASDLLELSTNCVIYEGV